MREHSIKAAPLARAADLNESAVRDILRGRSKNPGIVTLQKIAGVLNLRPSALFEAGALWPIVGEVDISGVSDRDESNSLDAVENPFFLSTPEQLSALRVLDDSLAPFAYKDDFLVFQADGAKDTTTSRPSVCSLKDGRTLVRLVRPGETEDDVTLMPLNPYAPAEAGVVLATQKPILFVLPQSLSSPTATPTHESSASVHETQKSFRRKKA